MACLAGPLARSCRMLTSLSVRLTYTGLGSTYKFLLAGRRTRKVLQVTGTLCVKYY